MKEGEERSRPVSNRPPPSSRRPRIIRQSIDGCRSCSRTSRSENFTSAENLESPMIRRSALMYTPFSFLTAFGAGAATNPGKRRRDNAKLDMQRSICGLFTFGAPRILDDDAACAAVALARL
eukprot:4176351-Pyramimonas_sp.AAC.1